MRREGGGDDGEEEGEDRLGQTMKKSARCQAFKIKGRAKAGKVGQDHIKTSVSGPTTTAHVIACSMRVLSHCRFFSLISHSMCVTLRGEFHLREAAAEKCQLRTKFRLPGGLCLVEGSFIFGLGFKSSTSCWRSPPLRDDGSWILGRQ